MIVDKFYNNKVFEGITKITDVMLIGFYFIFCSIPIFTIGASLTALYYATHKCIYKGKGYTTEFFHSFKDNFKQSTLSWLIFMVLFAVLSGDIYITRKLIPAGNPLSVATIFFAIVLLFIILWAIYHFAYIARFENGFGASFKISAIFMIANLGYTLVMLVLIVAIIYLVYKFMFLLFFLPGITSCTLHPILEKVFRRYMSEEDLIKEDQM